MMEEQVADDVDDLHFVSSALDDVRHVVAFTRRDRMSHWVAQLACDDSQICFAPEALCLPREGDECFAVIAGDNVVLRWSATEGARVDISILPIVLESLAEPPTQLVMYRPD